MSSDTPPDLSPILITGIMNPAGKPITYNGFDLTERELQIIVQTPNNRVSVMLEHNYDTDTETGMATVGHVVKFWLGADGRLWGMVEITPTAKFGPRAIRKVMSGAFTGFSLGVPFNPDLFMTRNEVLKLGLVEVSLVASPDSPCTTFVAVEGAKYYAEWARIEAVIRQIYANSASICPDATLDALMMSSQLWARFRPRTEM